MNVLKAREYAEKIDLLAVFRSLNSDPVISRFFELIKAASAENREEERIAYGRFTAALYETLEVDWSRYLEHEVLRTETVFSREAAKSNEVNTLIVDATMAELIFLDQLAEVGSNEFFEGEASAKWSNSPSSLADRYFERVMAVRIMGMGDFSENTFFVADDKNNLIPVREADLVPLANLYGYSEQHKQMMDSLNALLKGQPINDILLYGDAGTGKSAAVKAVVHELAGKGLRLVELKKEQLHQLPDLADILAENPLKFVIFVDDLSFESRDDDFTAMKAILEGSVRKLPDNLVIVATSNRRHLVRQSISERAADDMSAKEAMQESVSLAERFGQRILFDKPNAGQYADIVLGLAREKGLKMNGVDLVSKAERFALNKSSRSARAAKQLVDQLLVEARKDENDAKS